MLRLDIYSDTICPWCFIGKRRLERALAQRSQADVAIRWRAFQLNPGMPAEGMGRQAYLRAKFGQPERAQRIYDAIRSAGESEGIRFNFEQVRRTPNTLLSHRLLRLAWEESCQGPMSEALFRAYFLDGLDIGNADVLVDVAESIGLEKPAIQRFFESQGFAVEVEQEDRSARRLGISGVPCFIFNQRYALSGAQEPEAFFQLFDLARVDEEMSVEALQSP
jgi:predicted DsbA family dithiol-disulfide isomerase